VNVQTITRAAVGGSLRLARMPYDTALGVIPGDTAGVTLVLDRVDATVRGIAGAVLRDPKLREDARLRHAAAAERKRAVSLRAEAEQVGASADEQLEREHRRAQSRRTQADRRAGSRRQQAQRKQTQRRQAAAETEAQQQEKSDELEERVEEAIEAQAPAARLDAADAKAEAQAEQEQALTEADEAERLEHAAERAKEERKSAQS
jgi:flagellar biosynthesis GTPase FlhF